MKTASVKNIQCQKRIVTVRSITRNLQTAQSWVRHSVNPAFVIMGDAGEYWVVSGADAQRLEKVGYQLCPLS